MNFLTLFLYDLGCLEYLIIFIKNTREVLLFNLRQSLNGYHRKRLLLANFPLITTHEYYGVQVRYRLWRYDASDSMTAWWHGFFIALWGYGVLWRYGSMAFYGIV